MGIFLITQEDQVCSSWQTGLGHSQLLGTLRQEAVQATESKFIVL